ncbi:hypothetical protein [Iodobacter sp.]|uniref:hypothetical protein n=1 Tax=Iodobacter sp. TaxID=1915058 RepID=UPI0025FCBE2A|nr:hypothetical protein [Iodobacter sp.]
MASKILDKVNEITATIGQTPVDSLDESGNTDAINALATLKNKLNAILSTSASFNTTIVTLQVDKASQRVRVPSSYISIKAVDHWGIYVVKDGYLFDVLGMVFVDKPVRVEVCVKLELEDLPDPVLNLITAQAAVTFQNNYLGDPAQAAELHNALFLATIEFKRFDVSMGDYNTSYNPSVQLLSVR